MAEYGFDTLAVHAGAQPDPATGARITPIYQTSAYVFEDADQAAALFNLQVFGNIYSRIMNPTVAVMEERIAALEGGTAGLAASSGHAAQHLVFHTIMEPGAEFIAARQLYGGSVNQFSQSFKKYDWHVRWADSTDPDSFKRAVTDKTRAIFCESIANPGGVISDLEGIARVAADAGVPFIVDNTLATPYLLRPFEWGAHIVVHSATKFPWRPRQFAGGRDRRSGHLRLGEKRQLQDHDGGERLLSRYALLRDLRRFRVLRRGARAVLARPRPVPCADECVPGADRHGDAALAHAAPLRQRA